MAALIPGTDLAPTAAAVGGLLDQLGDSAGAVATVAVGILTFIGVILTRKFRAPVTINDLWKQNKTQATQINELTEKVSHLGRRADTQDRVVGILGDGFDAHSHAIERAGVSLDYTPSEQAAVDRARALRDDEHLWDALRNHTTPPEQKDEE